MDIYWIPIIIAIALHHAIRLWQQNSLLKTAAIWLVLNTGVAAVYYSAIALRDLIIPDKVVEDEEHNYPLCMAFVITSILATFMSTSGSPRLPTSPVFARPNAPELQPSSSELPSQIPARAVRQASVVDGETSPPNMGASPARAAANPASTEGGSSRRHPSSPQMARPAPIRAPYPPHIPQDHTAEPRYIPYRRRIRHNRRPNPPPIPANPALPQPTEQRPPSPALPPQSPARESMQPSVEDGEASPQSTGVHPTDPNVVLDEMEQGERMEDPPAGTGSSSSDSGSDSTGSSPNHSDASSSTTSDAKSDDTAPTSGSDDNAPTPPGGDNDAGRPANPPREESTGSNRNPGQNGNDGEAPEMASPRPRKAFWWSRARMQKEARNESRHKAAMHRLDELQVLLRSYLMDIQSTREDPGIDKQTRLRMYRTGITNLESNFKSELIGLESDNDVEVMVRVHNLEKQVEALVALLNINVRVETSDNPIYGPFTNVFAASVRLMPMLRETGRTLAVLSNVEGLHDPLHYKKDWEEKATKIYMNLCWTAGFTDQLSEVLCLDAAARLPANLARHALTLLRDIDVMQKRLVASTTMDVRIKAPLWEAEANLRDIDIVIRSLQTRMEEHEEHEAVARRASEWGKRRINFDADVDQEESRRARSHARSRPQNPRVHFEGVSPSPRSPGSPMDIDL